MIAYAANTHAHAAAVPVSHTPHRSHTLQRKCACGGNPGPAGECTECRRKRELDGTLQAKLRVNQPGDRYEREADRISESVVRRPATEVRGPETLSRPTSTQRCAASSTPAATWDAPPIVSEVLRTRGRPLDPATRATMESRFLHDFEAVRVHDTEAAAASAESVQAKAYTVGNDIVFGKGMYSPANDAGRRLLAHELAHVLQQRGQSRPLVQRTMVVENPRAALPGIPTREHWEDIRDSIQTLSADFSVASSGAVSVSGSTCSSPSRVTDQCLCDMHSSSNTWKIGIDDNEWPHTEEAAKRVVVQSTRSNIELGAWGGGAQAGTRVFMDQPRILGHELCGHAWLMEKGTHPSFAPITSGGRLMGRTSHDPTVTIENQVAGEITPGAPTRGLSSDPHHGESFGRMTISQYPLGSSDPSSLPSDMIGRIDTVERFMTATPFLKADVVGHADHTGTAAANTAISQKRADKMKVELDRRGVSSSRFNVTTGRSDAECPTAPADNPDCRKVEVFMYIFEGASERFP